MVEAARGCQGTCIRLSRRRCFPAHRCACQLGQIHKYGSSLSEYHDRPARRRARLAFHRHKPACREGTSPHDLAAAPPPESQVTGLPLLAPLEQRLLLHQRPAPPLTAAASVCADVAGGRGCGAGHAQERSRRHRIPGRGTCPARTQQLKDRDPVGHVR